MISLASCNKDNTENEIVDPHKREGVIKLYTNGEEIVFPEIRAYEFLEYSKNGLSYDTLGMAYTGYIDKSHSIINSVQLLIYDDLSLYKVDYIYPESHNVGSSFSRLNEDFDNTNMLSYHIDGQEDVIKGNFKGYLYQGGTYNTVMEPIVIDSCYFYFHK